jgi:single-strand DNA-binding protein
MARWGRGWEVGIRKAIYQHERALRIADELALATRPLAPAPAIDNPENTNRRTIMNREHISTAEVVGRLGQAPELKYTADQTPYVQLSVATSEGPFTDKSGTIREKTEWHRAVAWGELAERIAKTFEKGSAIALTGSMRINSFEKDGVKNRTTDLHVESADKAPDNARSKNEVRLVGVVREAPRPKQLENGSMTVLSVATTTHANGKEREDWHSVTVWGRAAEAAAREIAAGDTIAINGTLRHRSVGDEGRRLSAVECGRFQVLERTQERGQDKAASLPPPAADGPEKGRPRTRARAKGVERGM